MRKILLCSLVAVVAAGAAFAESASIAERKALFKEMGKASGPVGAMLQGKAPFDLAPVQAALTLYVDHAGKLKELFPDDSKEGGKTEAKAEIWANKAEFTALFDKFAADSTAAGKSIVDEASFKAEMGKVFGNCGTCHEKFKAKS